MQGETSHTKRSIIMKHISLLAAAVLLAAVIVMPGRALAGPSDTLTVYATPLNLEQVIGADTVAGGLQAHSVYKLVSLDTTYVFQGPMSFKSDVTVMGVPDPGTGRLPCIQPMPLPDNSLPVKLFILNGENMKATFRNLYLTGRSTENTLASGYDFIFGAGSLIQVAGSGNRLVVDRVVCCDWGTTCIGYNGDHTSIFVTNCKFRNCNVSNGIGYSGEAVRNTFNTAITDSLVMTDNTMFCISYSASCPVTVNPMTYFEFNHNSVIYTFKNPFWIYNATNAKVNDNLFYAAFAGASSLTEHFGMWDQLRSFEVTGVVDFDTLNMAMAAWFDPADTAGSGDLRVLWPAEAKRNIEVRNNVCFWPKVVTDFWKAWDDTAHVDSVVTPVWFNNRTAGMFADKVHWPNLTASGNLAVDPQLGASIDEVVNAGSTSGAGLFEFFTTIRTNAPLVEEYGYKIETVIPGNNWIPQWPLPELTAMQYANTALKTGGTDGKPVGDRGWFNGGFTGVEQTPSTLPGEFSLAQAYPNPFNPSTTVEFSLPKSGPVNLSVYNSLGQLVKVVLDNVSLTPGQHSYRISLGSASSGVYFYTLSQGNSRLTKSMVLLK
jgi:hypothetical protein